MQEVDTILPNQYNWGIEYLEYIEKEGKVAKPKDIQQKQFECFMDIGKAVLRTAQFLVEGVKRGDIKIDDRTGIVGLSDKYKNSKGIKTKTVKVEESQLGC